MSTPDYDMAPPAATATAPPPAAAPPPASGAAPATDPNGQRTQRRRAASQKDSSLAGLLIPGGVITGMISLCWLIHHFGLPVVLFSIMAAAAAATTVLVVRASRRAAQVASRNRIGAGAGGAGPGGGRRRGGPGLAGGGRSGGARGGAGGSRSGGGLGSSGRSGGAGAGGGGARRASGGAKGRAAPGALSRKPAGMGSTKAPGGRGGATNSSRRPSRGGLGGAGSSAGPKSSKGKALGAGTGSGTSGGGVGKNGKGLPGSGVNGGSKKPSGRVGLGAAASKALSDGAARRLGDRRKHDPATPVVSKIKDPKAGKKAAGKSGAGASAGTGRSAKASKGTTGPKRHTPASKGAGKPGKVGAAAKGPKGSGKKKGSKKVGKAKAPRHAGYTWKKNPLRKARGAIGVACRKGAGVAGVAGRKSVSAAGSAYHKVTSRKFRLRLRKTATPFRAMFRGSRNYGGKFLANVMRVGGRALLSINTFLGGIRYSTAGPNWLKPLSNVLFWATSPLARLVNVTRTWSWLNSWIFKTATARPLAKPAAKTGGAVPTAGGGTAAPAPTSGFRAPVPSPATASAGKVTPVDNSPVQHAYPLIYAADAIRQAATAFAAAPADSMRGYEAVIENLGHIEFSMCHLLNDVATVTEEDFKVSKVIPDQYRVLGAHFLMLGAFVDGAHQMYRQVHAEQLDNIENPTWQGRKWDISANWPHIMPMGAWSDPTVHAMPLLLASSAVRDAGIHIRLNPAGSMVGYEMTIEHLAPLAEELYALMETVAAVTEVEFRVHPAVTAMHRDAAQRFRDLGLAIQGVHILYRTLHSEQLLNLANPTHQAAKWDVSRNA
ncbi:hypothetical protein ABT039_22855 [Streptomyces lasiicapitis]|uniref:hypothetical protein n=1 Tax=Streptomyces lasiicapitis TaxID=1923961 RepID=UPI00331AD99E